jgi:small subunit ribosomal protein S5
MEKAKMDYQTPEFEQEYDERVIDIARVSKVVKGGRHFSFRVTVVAGDNRGKVGVGIGKANAVPDAMRKATEKARQNSICIVLHKYPARSDGKVGGAKVRLPPAGPALLRWRRACRIEAAGISDILTKSLGSSNILNVVYATVEAGSIKSPRLRRSTRKEYYGCYAIWSGEECLRPNPRKIIRLLW